MSPSPASVTHSPEIADESTLDTHASVDGPHGPDGPDPSDQDDDHSRRPRRHTRIARRVGLALVLAAIVTVIGAAGISRSRTDGDDITTEATATVISPDRATGVADPSPDSIAALIADLQIRLERVPGDHTAWATLGLAYVENATTSVDPTDYQRAEAALAESLAVDADDNFLAHAGLAALANARHEFAAARDHAEAGLAINDHSAILYGTLADAEVQLGDLDAAEAAVDRMNSLQPGTPSYARASYLAELRGDVALATALMQDALDAAPTPADEAFALYQLGELAFSTGDPNAALDFFNDARDRSPDDPKPLYGKARAEAAIGQRRTALDHYAELVERAPLPEYVAAYGEFLESLGMRDEAQAQYDVFDATRALFGANGVADDAGPLLFLADHGDAADALTAAEQAVAQRPFVAIHDAHAWALHRNGQDVEALAAIERALATGYRNASFLYHSGMIKAALDDDDGALADLRAALDLNPHFDPLDAPVAEATVTALAAAGSGS